MVIRRIIRSPLPFKVFCSCLEQIQGQREKPERRANPKAARKLFQLSRRIKFPISRSEKKSIGSSEISLWIWFCGSGTQIAVSEI
jgi:hypothetical protein